MSLRPLLAAAFLLPAFVPVSPAQQAAATVGLPEKEPAPAKNPQTVPAAKPKPKKTPVPEETH